MDFKIDKETLQKVVSTVSKLETELQSLHGSELIRQSEAMKGTGGGGKIDHVSVVDTIREVFEVKF